MRASGPAPAAAVPPTGPWPYGLVESIASPRFARRLNPDFFKDIKDSTIFQQALDADADERGVNSWAMLEEVLCRAEAFLSQDKPRTIADREGILEALRAATAKPDLTLFIGGKSCGKSRILVNITEEARAGAGRLVVLADMRETPSMDLFGAVLANVGVHDEDLGRQKLSRVIFDVVFTSFLAKIATRILGLLEGGADLAGAIAGRVMSLVPEARIKAFKGLVVRLQKERRTVTMIIDEANLAFPESPTQKNAKDALSQIVGITKQQRLAGFIIATSELSFPYALQKLGLNLADIDAIIVAAEVPPVHMIEVLTADWGLGSRLARLVLATYGGSPHLAYTALKDFSTMKECFFPLGVLVVPGVGTCVNNGEARRHLINIAMDGYSVVEDIDTDPGAELIARKNVGGIVPRKAKQPGVWPEAFTEHGEEYVLVASTHNVRLKICDLLLKRGYLEADDCGGFRTVSGSTTTPSL